MWLHADDGARRRREAREVEPGAAADVEDVPPRPVVDLAHRRLDDTGAVDAEVLELVDLGRVPDVRAGDGHPTRLSPRRSPLRVEPSRGPHASLRYLAGTPGRGTGHRRGRFFPCLPWDCAAAASFSTFAAEARSALRTSCAARVAGCTSSGSSLRLPIRRAAVTARRWASQRTTSSSYAVSPISSTSSTLLER